MTELIRDTAYGHLVRFLSRGKYLKFAEEEDPSIWNKSLEKKRSMSTARRSNSDSPETGSNSDGLGQPLSRTDSLSLFPSSQAITSGRTQSSRQRSVDPDSQSEKAIDRQPEPEKGVDPNLVTWYSDDDPDNVSTSSSSRTHGACSNTCL